jgi:hypothetical protein
MHLLVFLALAWSKLTITSEDASTHWVGMILDVYPDGRVVFGWGDEKHAPSVAHAPPELIQQVDAWAKEGPKPGPALTGKEVWVVHVELSGAKHGKATYLNEKLPADVKAIYEKVDALINSPREALPCTAWDGKGEFTLLTYAQDFGVAAGPTYRLTVSSSGAVELARAQGAVNAKFEPMKSTKATPDEVQAIRAAIVGVELGHFTDVFGGAGEGSNLRTMILKTSKGTCARSFTNKFPDGLKPLNDAIDPVTKRL